jgi:hypothetical protein
MFRGNNRVGVFIMYKLKVQPFTEKKIELVTTFADRRLLPPRAPGCSMSFVSAPQRINDLSAALEQQTATSEVLLPPEVADLIVASDSEKQLESHRWSRIIQTACGASARWFRHVAY